GPDLKSVSTIPFGAPSASPGSARRVFSSRQDFSPLGGVQPATPPRLPCLRPRGRLPVRGLRWSSTSWLPRVRSDFFPACWHHYIGVLVLQQAKLALSNPSLSLLLSLYVIRLPLKREIERDRS